MGRLPEAQRPPASAKASGTAALGSASSLRCPAVGTRGESAEVARAADSAEGLNLRCYSWLCALGQATFPLSLGERGARREPIVWRDDCEGGWNSPRFSACCVCGLPGPREHRLSSSQLPPPGSSEVTRDGRRQPLPSLVWS